MPTLIIDGKEISVKPGSTIMEAAQMLGVFIPHFCYHPKLPIDGNCRMCLVEVEKMPKPVVACAMPVNDGMVVRTESDMVKKARRGVMEFLLINHPLDCPVCDQGGECRLQDFAMKYGPDRARFGDDKRDVNNKELGPLIETEMDRCIHCTRCIRFSREIAGTEEMGAMWRGDHMEVGTFVKKTLTSELTGNLAEVCPVGALNHKPFHFQARGWELKHAFGVCNHCSVGCQVRRDRLENKVIRVEAAHCDSINETWLCDKGRYAVDGLTVKRVKQPQVRKDSSHGISNVGWQEALDAAAELLKSVKAEEVAGIAAADRQGAEELYAFQDFLRNTVGTRHIDFRVRQRDYSADESVLTRADLFMNTPLEKLQEADAILVVGADSRYETPIMNLRIRKAARNGAKVFSLGPRALDSNVPGLVNIVRRPGQEPVFLKALLAGLTGATASTEVKELTETLKGAQRPVVIIGDHAINHPQAELIRRQCVAVMDACGALTSEWNGYNRVPTVSNAAAAQDMGVIPHRGPGYKLVDNPGYHAQKILKAAAEGEVKVLFILGNDLLTEAGDTQLAKQAIDKAKVIWLGAFDSETVKQADVVLPGMTVTEKDATLTNVEGRVQRSNAAVKAEGEAKEDWRILRALSDRFATSLSYNTIDALRTSMAAVDHRYDLDKLSPQEMPVACDHSPVTTGLDLSGVGSSEGGAGLCMIVEVPFYFGDPVARRSPTMAKLDAGNRLRINPKDAQVQGIVQDQKVRVIQGETKIEVIATLDEHVPEGTIISYSGYAPGPSQDLCQWDGGFPTVSLAGL
ncbi:MAG: NADH-quinone oxidoreductase subunit NuoG [Magnetococcales bacterium]|nr:NADH-quinone oxidoreductase subunit NuoG [Magnetococcales bacterium]